MTNSAKPPLSAGDRTRQRILIAATEEFAARGLAGARIQTIVERAPANSRLVYAHFGSKEGLFAAVLEHAVTTMRDAVELDPDDLPGYAEAVFDAYAADHTVVRLALWQALEKPELGELITPARDSNRIKAEIVRAAQRDGRLPGLLDANDLLSAIATLIYGNLVLADGIDNYTPERRRAVRQAVTRLIAF